MSTITSFDLAGPLPTGTTVLEASAGTGKTYTIAGLVARYVADGRSLTELLVVTFTRAATAELRDRVRRRLVETADALEAIAAGAPAPGDDAVLTALSAGGPDALRERRERLLAAIGEFDAATIATIHGFCQQVLQSIGFAGDIDRDPTFLEDQTDIIEAVVDDALVRTFHQRPAGVEVSRDHLLKIARAVVSNPDATLARGDRSDPTIALRLDLATAIQREVDRRKRAAGQLSYDDVLTRLADTLAHPTRGPAARRRLRERYRIALIDEFQDTDPTQWRIVDGAFGNGGPASDGDAATLVLIGDPKQAIYSFRGADVHAYLRAATHARQATLDTNWRSDGDLLTAFNVLFRGATLGHPDIPYREVQPAPANRAQRLVGAPVRAPLRLRVLGREGARTTPKNYLYAGATRERIGRDLAVQVVDLLTSQAQVIDRRPDGTERTETVQPRHIAVLARTNAEAALVQRTLREAGVPAVINGVGSVFASQGAADWLRLLEALEKPSSPIRARTAALTTLMRESADEVAAARDDDEVLERIARRLHRWAATLRDRSVASLFETITYEEELPARLLACHGGERALTDLEHVAELLHAAQVAEDLAVSSLANWLRERMAEAETDVPADEQARRLESDAEAVQVLTVHRSKGLEFPIVCCPFLWSPSYFEGTVPLFHDRDTDQRVIDVAGSGDDYKDHKKDAEREQRGEDLRLLYVALTRAKHQVLVWWAPAYGSWESPLTKLLLCRSPDGRANTAATSATIPDDATITTRLQPLVEAAGGRISLEAVAATIDVPRWEPPAEDAGALDAATFVRTLDRSWRRTSYSALTAVAHEEPVSSEPEEQVVDDEAPLARLADPEAAAPDLTEAQLRAIASPLADAPGGTEFGTFVHAILEHTDFTAGDLRGEVAARVREQQERRQLELDEAALTDALVGVVETPLGPIADGLPLRAFGPADRLDELAFELPLVGGDRSGGGAVTVARIGELLRRWVGPGDPLHGYADRLADAQFRRDVRGYLTGSIDLVLRVPGAVPRFVVVDHKTNRLTEPGEELTAWHYRPAALADAMIRGHYPLQALLYSVALHRYLRWRMGAGYDPAQHLGGIAYLFVRGMCGPDTAALVGGSGIPGVFAWTPPAGLVVALSDLLASGEVAA